MKKSFHACKPIMMLGVAAMFLYSCSSSNSSENNAGIANTVGQPVSSSYSEPVNEELAAKGKELFNTKCISCHQMDARVVGPPLRGITNKRSHDWLVKMLENPEDFVKTDAVAKQLFEEYNTIPMVVPGGTTEEDRKAIIDYLRKEG